MEQYHVVETHPQLRIAGRYAPPDRATFESRAFIDADIHYLRTMSEGMAGMVHANDVRIAEGLRDMELPADPELAVATWKRALNDAVVRWHRAAGHDIPDLNDLEARGLNEPMGFCFPHSFVLPMYSSASSYRFRPLGPEETLMEIWSLTRYPQGSEPPTPTPPEPWESDDPRWPPIPAQDFSNLPRQQTRPAREGLRVHAPLRTDGGRDLELRTDGRRLPRRPSLREAAPGAAVGQRQSRSKHRSPTSASEPGGRVSTNATYAEVVEGIRATIAAYTHALDDGRTDDVVATFCPDGVCDIPGMGTHVGHDALRAAYASWKPRRPQRHLVVNTLVTDWNEHEASAVSDVIFILQGDAGWAIEVVGRYHDTLHYDDGTWRFHRRAAEFVT